MAAFITVSDLQNILSRQGVNLRVDDVPPTELGGVLEDASEQVKAYLGMIHTSAGIEASSWCKDRAAEIAAQDLCSRRANPVPTSIKERAEHAYEQLERVQGGGLKLLIARIGSQLPSLLNTRHRSRPWPNNVVVKSQSVRVVATNIPSEILDVGYILDYVI